MVFSAVRAAILRGSQELAPQDDGGDCFAASTMTVRSRRQPSPRRPLKLVHQTRRRAMSAMQNRQRKM